MGNALISGILSAELRVAPVPPVAKPSGQSGDRSTRSAAPGNDRLAISAPFGIWLDDSGCMVVCVDLERADRPPRAGDRLIGWTANGAGVMVREFSYAEVGVAGRTRGPGAGPRVEDVRLVALVVGRYRPE